MYIPSRAIKNCCVRGHFGRACRDLPIPVARTLHTAALPKPERKLGTSLHHISSTVGLARQHFSRRSEAHTARESQDELSSVHVLLRCWLACIFRTYMYINFRFGINVSRLAQEDGLWRPDAFSDVPEAVPPELAMRCSRWGYAWCKCECDDLRPLRRF